MLSTINHRSFFYTPPEKTGDELQDQIAELMAYRSYLENERKRRGYLDGLIKYMSTITTQPSAPKLNMQFIKNNILGIQ